jgi:hypothetical protein
VLTVTAVNRTQSTTLAEHCQIAASLVARVVGLIGRPSLRRGEGLWIQKCNSIHMIGVRFPIDVIFLDGEQRVVKLAATVRPPFHLRACFRRANSVIELPVGVIADSGTNVGDMIEFVPRAEDGEAVG